MSKFLQWSLAPLGGVWMGINALRNTLFDRRGPKGKLPRPVISIGNITWGGTGKTPLLAWLHQRLTEEGLKPAILSRGYGASDIDTPLLVSGPGISAPPWVHAGDEPLLLAQLCPGAVIARGADRLAAGRLVLEHFPEVTHFLLDDAFQHRRLHRDLDVVLLPRRRNHLRWPPLGELREPLRPALKRADYLVKNEGGCGFPGGVPKAKKLYAKSLPQSLLGPDGEAVDSRHAGAVSWCLVTGIANPERVIQDLMLLGAEPKMHLRFADHHPFTPGDLPHLDGSWRFVTTAKDAVRWPKGAPDPYILSHGIELQMPGSAVLLEAIRNL